MIGLVRRRRLVDAQQAIRDLTAALLGEYGYDSPADVDHVLGHVGIDGLDSRAAVREAVRIG